MIWQLWLKMQKAVTFSCYAAVRATFKQFNALTVFFIVDVGVLTRLYNS